MESNENEVLSDDKRIVELLEMLTNHQMQSQAADVNMVCGYVEAIEKQLSSMTEEIKSMRKELVSMKEDTVSKHMKEQLQKALGAVSKQCDILKEQIREVKQEICEKAEKIVERAKQKGRVALYKVAEVTGVRKKLLSIKDKVDRAVDRMESLEQSVGEYHRQQGKGSQSENPLLDGVVAEPQVEYGAELFEQYQREHGAEQVVEAVGQVARQEVGKSR
ncbi:MAG: hypothetical protein K2L07_12285 [Lachnospiraceae bacterium]|nr:hypothetical protein [Lachnospiraceae bacterium]